MQIALELLAPAGNKDIGIAAIDCGADAVYIAGPSFGAREAAGNSFDDIATLADYAHRFGAKVYLTLNTILFDSELEDARRSLFSAYDAGCDAVIVQDLGILKMEIPPIELHASTQCNIRTLDQVRFLESLGFTRVVLARELSLEQIAQIKQETTCELECFIHGALCVSYSGQCYMSQYLSGRSANRGRCIQACRSRYDLTDMDGNVLVKSKSLLSLKDFSLERRIGDMARAGVVSFKIEGRLKNISYVKNIVRMYRQEIDELIDLEPQKYCRSSLGVVEGGFTPCSSATFCRGYTTYFIDGNRKNAPWSSMDTAKGVGELVGRVGKVSPLPDGLSAITVKYDKSFSNKLANGDGLCYVNASGQVQGVRVETVSGERICVKSDSSLKEGLLVFRNYNRLFEKELERNMPKRLIGAKVTIECPGGGDMVVNAVLQDGRSATGIICGPVAENREQAIKNIVTSFSKTASIFRFSVEKIEGEDVPFIPASSLNALRRELAAKFEPSVKDDDQVPQYIPSVPLERVSLRNIHIPQRRDYLNCSNHLSRELYESLGITPEPAYELVADSQTELMRTKYCLRNELGICPKIKKGVKASPLVLVNNGKRMRVDFDCRQCEMSIRPYTKD
ncbi:MAG: U32 family peptidase [Candidatus Coprenecus sp.]|nr:U32 family peptidase [Candidatus Coprenecus sp.]